MTTVAPTQVVSTRPAYPLNEVQITVVLALAALCAKAFAVFLYFTQRGSMTFTFSLVVAILVSVGSALMILHTRQLLQAFKIAANSPAAE